MSEMPEAIKVRLSGGIVSARLVKENKKTIWVKLKDGNIIKRHKEKHVVKEDSPVGETIKEVINA